MKVSEIKEAISQFADDETISAEDRKQLLMDIDDYVNEKISDLIAQEGE